MKHPGIDNCPCCGVKLTTWAQSDRHTVDAGCYQSHDASGNVDWSLLQWTCRICGLKWRHCQTFGEGEGKQ
jgi:hypothetical protein